ncbi:MAG: hypothetical protein ABIL01_30150 [Pseudomonadota bacterium]
MEDPVWRIDTLDARAGLAFASLRKADFPEDGVLPNAEAGAARNPPCVFISAPGFQPEMVANRALALAGMRGTFQFRFYIGGDEVGFRTLADLTDFVRRAYLRSGGGDGADGGGGVRPSPRPTDGDRPKLPPPPEYQDMDGSLATKLAIAAEDFHKASNVCTLGTVSKFKWPPDARSGGGGALTQGPHVLASAALALIFEMMHRMPDGKDADKTNRWHDDARTLGCQLTAMKLWPVLDQPPYRHLLETLMASLNGKTPLLQALTVADDFPGDWRYCFLRFVLFGSGPALDDGKRAVRIRDATHEWWYRDWPLIPNPYTRALVDPIVDLCRLPLPPAFATSIRTEGKSGTPDKSGEISLYHALVASIGSPATLKSSPLLCALVLFAATWVVTHNDTPGADFRWPREFPIPPSPFDEAALQSKLDRGWSWLREHLPTHCFALAVEQAIEGASDLKYRQGPTLNARAGA